MKIILLGATGYLGSRIAEYFLGLLSGSRQSLEPAVRAGSKLKLGAKMLHYELVPLRVDVTDLEAVRRALKGVEGQVVINATGKTGSPNVDWCEDHKLETARVNITGAINVANVASEQGNFMVQLGSGCIFDSFVSLRALRSKAKQSRNDMVIFTEGDPPNFFGSFYSQTKAIAEGALKEIPNVCILRIRMPLSEQPHPKNLLTKLLQYKKILNAPNSVTVIEDFLPFLEKVIEKRVTGVLNAVNPGVYHHQDLLDLYQKRVDPNRQFEYITLGEFKGMTKASRSNCVLSTKKSEDLGIAMPSIETRLESLIEAYKKGRG